MRIVILSDFGYIEGGATRVAITSAEALARRGHEVTFFTGVGDDSPFDSSVDFVTANGQSTRANPRRTQAALQGLWNVNTRKLLEQLMRTSPPETIFHVHTWTKALSNSVLHLLASRGDKVVVTLHEYFSICPNGCYYNFPKGKMCELKPLSIACVASNCDSRSYPEKLWRVGRHALQSHVAGFPAWCRNFIALSELSLERARPFLDPRSRFYKVANPVELPSMARVDPACNNGYLMLGRLAGEKGPDLFAKAAKLCGIIPRFVGEGPEQDQVLSANPDSELIGWQNKQAVTQELAKARVVVFPSRWDETAGLAVLEAASLGIPSIVSDGCAAREFVGKNERGLLFENANIKDLAQKLKLVQEDGSLVKKLGAAAYSAVPVWAPSPERHAELLEDVYNQVIS